MENDAIMVCYGPSCLRLAWKGNLTPMLWWKQAVRRIWCVMCIGVSECVPQALIIQKCPPKGAFESDAYWSANAWEAGSGFVRQITKIINTICDTCCAAIINENRVAVWVKSGIPRLWWLWGCVRRQLFWQQVPWDPCFADLACSSVTSQVLQISRRKNLALLSFELRDILKQLTEVCNNQLAGYPCVLSQSRVEQVTHVPHNVSYWCGSCCFPFLLLLF